MKKVAGRTLVTADWHLFHRGILDFCPSRPWDDVEHMSVSIAWRVANYMTDADHLYFLGDLFFGIGTNRDKMAELLWDIPGRITAIVGNHDEPDRWGRKIRGRFESIVPTRRG